MKSKNKNNAVNEALKIAERKLTIFADELSKPDCDLTGIKSCLKNKFPQKRKLSVSFSEKNEIASFSKNTVGISKKDGHDSGNGYAKGHNSLNTADKNIKNARSKTNSNV